MNLHSKNPHPALGGLAGSGPPAPGELADLFRPDVSVIILNWNTQEITSRAVASLKEMTQGISLEVILIDNGSTTDTSATELPLRFPDVYFVANSKNLGFCRGCNQGVRVAQGRYVLLLNSDTIQTENAIGKAVRYMDGHHDVGALGILHRNDNEPRSPQASAFPFPDPWLSALSLITFRPAAGGPVVCGALEQDVDWCCGSFLLIRSECFQQVGPLDERFFAYDEDIDWCRRARELGWKIRFWPAVSLVHIGSASAAGLGDKTLIHFRNRLTYFAKHYSFMGATAYYIAMVFRLSVAATAHLVRALLMQGSFEGLGVKLGRLADFTLLKGGANVSKR